MPEPSIENQFKVKLFEWELINRNQFNRGKFFNYTETDIVIINDFKNLDLNSNKITMGFICDDEVILDGISIFNCDTWTHSSTCYINHLTFNNKRYIIAIDDI